MFSLLKYELKKAHFFWVYLMFLIISAGYLAAIAGISTLPPEIISEIPVVSLILSVNSFSVIWTLLLCTYLGIELFHNEYDQNTVHVLYTCGLGRPKILFFKAFLLFLTNLLMSLSVVVAAFWVGQKLLPPDDFWPHLAGSIAMAFLSSSFIFLPLAIGMLFKRKSVTVSLAAVLLLVIGGNLAISSFANRPTQILLVTLAAASFASFYALIYHLSSEDI